LGFWGAIRNVFFVQLRIAWLVFMDIQAWVPCRIEIRTYVKLPPIRVGTINYARADTVVVPTAYTKVYFSFDSLYYIGQIGDNFQMLCLSESWHCNSSNISLSAPFALKN